MRESTQKRNLSVTEIIIMRFIAAILFSSLFVLMDDKQRFVSIQTLNKFSDYRFLLCYVIIFCAITIFVALADYLNIKNMDAFFLMTSSFIYGTSIALNTTDIYYIATTGLFVVLVFWYIVTRLGYTYKYLKLSDRKLKIILAVFIIINFLYLLTLLLLRVYLFKCPTFDFGIFVQMFHYMKNEFIPYTTCERDKLLSHFTIHFSPIYYFILPFYMVFTSPYTLIVVQLIAVLSGIIPVYLMCRNKKASNIATLAMCLAYLFYPTLRGGLFFDFHENKFLAPLVLWLLYFFELEKFGKKKLMGITVFTFLILMVKEDAPIYTTCIGLFEMFYKSDKRDKIAGFSIAVFSVIYFFVVFHFMGIYGDAGSAITSFGRYENLMVSDYDGVPKLVLNMLKNPAYVIKQLMTAEKLEFILWMFLPVLFLPFRTRKISSLILLIPLVVLNLLSNYGYQHSIYYQYAYASGVLVLYAAFLELSKMKGIRGQAFSICMIVMSLLMSISCISDRSVYYNDYVRYHEKVDEVRELLEKIPKEASVSSSTFYLPVIAQRNEIYRHKTGDETDYIVLTLSDSEKDINLREADEYMKKGYRLFGEIEDRIIILEKINK